MVSYLFLYFLCCNCFTCIRWTFSAQRLIRSGLADGLLYLSFPIRFVCHQISRRRFLCKRQLPNPNGSNWRRECTAAGKRFHCLPKDIFELPQRSESIGTNSNLPSLLLGIIRVFVFFRWYQSLVEDNWSWQQLWLFVWYSRSQKRTQIFGQKVSSKWHDRRGLLQIELTIGLSKLA